MIKVIRKIEFIEINLKDGLNYQIIFNIIRISKNKNKEDQNL